MAVKYFNAGNVQVKSSGKKVIIEGWANKNVMDDIGDVVNPHGARLQRFDKNPILLFNHNHSMPIGRVIAYKATDEGFWVKAEISDSDVPEVKYIRDMIEGGYLKTFSIGFAPHKEKRREDGSNLIEEWTLHEVSVVSLPMNADSDFALAKSFDTLLAGKKFDEATKCLKLGFKRSSLVKELLPHNSKSILTAISEAAGKPVEEIAAVFSGNTVPAPEDILNAIAEVLGADKETLMKLNGASEDPDEPKEPEPPEGVDPSGGEDDKETKESSFEKCVAAKLPGLIQEGKPHDEAMALAISACEESGKCSLTPEQKLSVIERFKQDQQPPTTAIPATDVAPAVSTTPVEDNLKTQTAMMGELINLGKAILDVLTRTAETQRPAEQNNSGDETVPSAVQENSSGSVGSPNLDGEGDNQEDDEVKAIMERINQKLKILGV